MKVFMNGIIHSELGFVQATNVKNYTTVVKIK